MNIPQQRIGALVFDLDGVLVDGFEAMRAAFAQAYGEVVGEGDPPFEEYVRHQGRWFRDIMRLMELPEEMEGPFVRASAEMVHQVKVYQGVPELLQQLRSRGVHTAVATGKAAARARHVLAATGLLPWLDCVVGTDEVARSKPAPDIVQEALRRLHVEPSEAVMVGDAWVDISSGNAAGTTTVGALWGPGKAHLLNRSGPDHLMDRPEELLSLVNNADQLTGRRA